jgi:transcriptional regulator with XRE-family HTH domain
MSDERIARLTRALRLAADEQGRRVREQSGISLRELATFIGTSHGELSRWERGVSRPRPTVALRWLEAVESIRSALDEGAAVRQQGQP